jgi:murein L,D-transpeptidase YafK
MCRWSGQLGPKKTEGDRQVPEGFYTIAPGQMNPNSHYYLSFNVGYPNAYDRAHGYVGGNIMVHGICSSAGCFSMTDKQIEEIYALARESFAGGQRQIQMQSYPFRMTADNMAKLRLDPNMPFWREIKNGADHFEITKQEVPVGVCAKHYVFGAEPKTGRFDALSPCPALARDPTVEAAVEAREAVDDKAVAELVSKGVKPVKIVYADGGQNAEFAHKVADVSRPDALAAGPTEIALDETPKAKPAAVQLAALKSKSAAPAAAKPAVQTAAAVPTGGATAVPATFAAAPSAYAKDEPKSDTEGFFNKWLHLGSSDTPGATPANAVAPAVAPAPPVAVVAATDKKLATKHVAGRATPPKPEPTAPAAAPSAPAQAQASTPLSPLLRFAQGWQTSGDSPADRN